jgi:hypothetical protein
LLSLELWAQVDGDKAAIPNQYIVHAAKELPPFWTGANGAFYAERLDSHLPFWLVNYVGSNEKLGAEFLLTQEYILTVQNDHRLEYRNTVPNDSNYFRQWHLKNTGQIGGTPGLDIDAEIAWDSTTGGITAAGDTIVIAIIDSKVDLDHLDINWRRNYLEIPNNGIDDDSNGYVDDYHGWNTKDSLGNHINIQTQQSFIDHGTHIAGIIGAKGNNSIGVSGISWGAQVMPVVTDLSILESEVVKAYGYVMGQKRDYLNSSGAKGAYIVATNSSFGVNAGNPANYPIWCAMYDSMGTLGILSAGATANSFVNVGVVGDIPSLCSSDYLIVVTNSDNNDVPVSSAYSETFVDLAAPGTAIYSTKPANSYGNKTGTSMASPQVAGSIGLIYANLCTEMIQASKTNPDSVALLVADMILQSVDPVDVYKGITSTGGRLNVGRAMQLSRNFNCADCGFQLMFSYSDPSCAGDSSGSIQVFSSDTSVSAQWNIGGSDLNLNAVAAGFYRVIVSDTACNQSRSFFLNDPSALELNAFLVEPDTGGNSGRIVIQVTGGEGLMEYRLNGGNWQSLGVFSNLNQGLFLVEARDSIGCIYDTLIQVIGVGIPQVDDLPVSLFPNPTLGNFSLLCPSGELAKISIYDVFGNELYSIEPRSPRADLSIANFTSGTYLIRYRDNRGAGGIRTLIKY